MPARLIVATLSLTAALAGAAVAQQSSVVVVTPGYTVNPYPSVLSSQFNNPAFNRYPPGAQTCVASGFTCPASAPNTPGLPCTCETKNGDTMPGVVR
jgi:hypothetical protein